MPTNAPLIQMRIPKEDMLILLRAAGKQDEKGVKADMELLKVIDY